MPLHTESEGFRVRNADPFDQAIRRRGFDLQAVSEPIDALAMQEQIGEAPIDNMDEREMPRTAMPDNTAELMRGMTDRSQMPRTANMETNI